MILTWPEAKMTGSLINSLERGHLNSSGQEEATLLLWSFRDSEDLFLSFNSLRTQRVSLAWSMVSVLQSSSSTMDFTNLWSSLFNSMAFFTITPGSDSNTPGLAMCWWMMMMMMIPMDQIPPKAFNFYNTPRSLYVLKIENFGSGNGEAENISGGSTMFHLLFFLSLLYVLLLFFKKRKEICVCLCFVSIVWEWVSFFLCAGLAAFIIRLASILGNI